MISEEPDSMSPKPSRQELINRIRALEKSVAQKRVLEEELKSHAHSLVERVKELRCLYGISRLLEETPDSQENLIGNILKLIPPAWQYPEITVARIVLYGKEYRTPGFKETPWAQIKSLALRGENIGSLEVYYTEERPNLDDGPFLKEERRLLDVIAERLGGIIERVRTDEALKRYAERLEELVTERTAELISSNQQLKREIRERRNAEETLRKREKELEKKTINLEEVNTALKILLKQRDRDKSELEEKVFFNINELVLPYIEKLKQSGLEDIQSASVEIIEDNLQTIVSPLSRNLTFFHLNFTPTEIQIANFVRHGHRSKEVAEMLGLSLKTIETHRKNIRKKLGLRNKKTNLRTHLLGMDIG